MATGYYPRTPCVIAGVTAVVPPYDLILIGGGG